MKFIALTGVDHSSRLSGYKTFIDPRKVEGIEMLHSKTFSATQVRSCGCAYNVSETPEEVAAAIEAALATGEN